MLNIVHIIVSVLNTIAIHFINIITTPIKAVLESSIPNFDYYLLMGYNFISNYLLKGFQFIKMVVFNLFGIDQNVWLLFIGAFGIMSSLYLSFLGLRLGYNIWRIFQGSNGSK